MSSLMHGLMGWVIILLAFLVICIALVQSNSPKLSPCETLRLEIVSKLKKLNNYSTIGEILDIQISTDDYKRKCNK